MAHRATTLAEQAATAIHELAHLTRPAVTTLNVDDLRAIAGALAELAAGLPQTLNQLSSYLHTDHDQSLTGRPPIAHAHTTASQTRACLRQATAAAAHLAATLDTTHQTLGNIAETTESDQGGSIFNRR